MNLDENDRNQNTSIFFFSIGILNAFLFSFFFYFVIKTRCKATNLNRQHSTSPRSRHQCLTIQIILKFPRLCNISHNKIQEPRFSLLSRLNIIIRNIYLSISGKSKIVEFINFENPRVRVRAISKVLIPRIFFINLKNNTSLLAQS